MDEEGDYNESVILTQDEDDFATYPEEEELVEEPVYKKLRTETRARGFTTWYVPTSCMKVHLLQLASIKLKFFSLSAPSACT